MAITRNATFACTPPYPSHHNVMYDVKLLQCWHDDTSTPPSPHLYPNEMKTADTHDVHVRIMSGLFLSKKPLRKERKRA
jgi:hypothetical protein